MYEISLKGLRSNQHFLVWELERRGVSVELLDRPHELVAATFAGRTEYLVDIDSSLMPYPASVIADNKFMAKLILARGGMRITTGREFHRESLEDALEYASSIGFPVVVKPSKGANGEEVYVGLEHPEEITEAAERLLEQKGDVGFLVEEYFEGSDVRIFVTRAGAFAVLHREPPYVTGDGERSIEELCAEETQRRKEPGIARLAPVALDHISDAFLRRQGLSRNTVLSAGRKVTVRPNANVGSGGISEDITERVHPSLVEIAEKTLACFPGMPYAGIDILSKDFESAQSEDSYRILEVNPLPSLGIHMMPARGESHNVAAMVVDLLFPETKEA